MTDVDAHKGTELSLGALELPKLEAVVELMFLAAYADGTVSPEERAVFESHIAAGTQGMMGRSAVEAMISAIEKALASEGREARFSVIRRRLGDARVRKAALAIAIRVLHADKVVVPREVAWLMRAAAALEIDPEEANALLHEEAPPDSKVLLGAARAAAEHAPRRGELRQARERAKKWAVSPGVGGVAHALEATGRLVNKNSHTRDPCAKDDLS